MVGLEVEIDLGIRLGRGGREVLWRKKENCEAKIGLIKDVGI